MFTILGELDRAFPFEFKELDDGKEEILAFGKSDKYADKPLRFDTTDPAVLRVEMNHGLLQAYVTPVLENPEGRVRLHVPSIEDTRFIIPRFGEWVCFDLTNNAYQADREVYLNLLHFVLSLYLLEHGKQIPFDAMLNSA